MERGHILSLRQRIALADESKLGEIAKELLAFGPSVPKEVIEALTQRLNEGLYINLASMQKLILLFRDRDLYKVQHTRALILGQIDSLIALLGAEIPDAEIEERLCKYLARDFEENNYGGRGLILEALRDHGSIHCLDTLEAIEFDFYSRFRTAKVIADALGNSPLNLKESESFAEWADGAVRSADLMLGKLIREVISAVRARNFKGEYGWSVPPALAIVSFSQVDEYVALAVGHLDGDLGAALNNIRKALESLLKTVIKLRGIKPRSQDPIERMGLPALISILMDKNNTPPLEKYIHQYLTNLQNFTTLGSHDQGVPINKLVDKDTVEGLLSNFKIIQNFFESYVREETNKQ